MSDVRRGRALAAVSAGAGCVQLDALALNPALPEISRELGGEQAWVITAYMLAAGASMPAAGRAEVRRPTPMDWPGLVTVTMTCAGAVLLVDRLPEFGPGSALVLGGIVLLLLGFARARRGAPRSDLLRNARYLALTGAGAVSNAATVGLLFTVPAVLQAERGMSAIGAGVALLFPAVLMACAGPLAGRVDLARAEHVMAVCTVTAGFALVLPDPAQLAAVSLAGLALGVANAVALAGSQAVVDEERAGQAAGISKAVITIAGGFGAVLTESGSLVGVGAGCFVVAVLLGVRRVR